MFALRGRQGLIALLQPPSIPRRLLWTAQTSHSKCHSRRVHSTSPRVQYIPSLNTSRFTPLTPLTPATLPKPPPNKTPSATLPKPLPKKTPSSPSTARRPRLRKTRKTILTLFTLTLFTYLLDKHLNYSTLTRSLRSLYTAVLISADYKLNFTSHKSASQLSSLHSRNADRLVNLCLSNGGLYQKIGQAIAMQSALLPAEFQAKFAQFFSDTPQASRAEIERVIRQEFPQFRDPVNELFVPGTFTNRAMGSASVAQVHKAQLNDGRGTWVAVKIQKPGISRQVWWDLAVFRFVMGEFSEKLFGLPLGFVVPYICERLESETDFTIELKNSLKMRNLIALNLNRGEIRTGWGGWLFNFLGRAEGRVYVPKVYPDLSTKRVLVAEWIDGIPLAHGRRGGFKDHNISPTIVMSSLLWLFSRQMFWWGDVHCDPHPGNILVRKVPQGRNSFDYPHPHSHTPSTSPLSPQEGKMVTEVVLLDHGLYIHLPPHLRRQYARLWTALMALDTQTVSEITSKWGFGNAEMVASMTMLRPYRGSIGVDINLVGPGSGVQSGDETAASGNGDGKRELTPYERQLHLQSTLRSALLNDALVPRELVFLGRCMRILQANNQLLGSPVNRLNILARSASESLLPGNPNYMRRMVGGWVKGYWRYLVFRCTMILLDLGWWWAWLRSLVVKGGEGGFEEVIEERMRRVAREEWGVEIGGGVFRG